MHHCFLYCLVSVCSLIKHQLSVCVFNTRFIRCFLNFVCGGSIGWMYFPRCLFCYVLCAVIQSLNFDLFFRTFSFSHRVFEMTKNTKTQTQEKTMPEQESPVITSHSLSFFGRLCFLLPFWLSYWLLCWSFIMYVCWPINCLICLMIFVHVVSWLSAVFYGASWFLTYWFASCGPFCLTVFCF